MATIKPDGYHIHFYCENDQLTLCNEVRTRMISELSEIDGAGPVRDHPVGPHPLPMFEAWFASANLDVVVRWTLANRHGLSVLIHPLSGDDLADHRDHAIWIGKPLPLKLEIF